MSDLSSTIALVLIILTTLIMIWEPTWRWKVLVLAVQYLAVFLLVNQMWPLSLAAVKLIAGWMAGALLGASYHGNDTSEQTLSLSARLFRLIASGLVFALVFSLAQEPQNWIQITQVPLSSGLILIGMGLLQLGLAAKPLNVVIGLLTTLSGFEVIYAAVVSSVLVTGLLAVITLGAALVGSYWMVSPAAEEVQ